MTNWRTKDYSLQRKIHNMSVEQVRKRLIKLDDILEPTPAQNEEYKILQDRLTDLSYDEDFNTYDAA